MAPDDEAAIELLRKGLSELKIPYQDSHIGKFRHYLHALMTLPYNLTAIKTPEDSVTLHFLDSLAALPLLAKALSGSVCDVGSGAGFPLLPIKIFHSELDCTFIDSRIKSTSFIESLCQQLDLSNCKVIHEHTSQLRKQKISPYRIIISRAFGNVEYILKECLPLLESGGYLFLYKGPRVHEEIKNIPSKIFSSIEIISTDAIKVPFLDQSRFLLSIQKK